MIRLECDGLDTLVLDDWETGINCSQLDLGWPASRPVVQDRPGGDGTIDQTTRLGARLLTVTLDVYAGQDGQTRRSNLDALARFCHPSRRPLIVWADPTDGVERQAVLRPDVGSAPMLSDRHTDVSISWVVPSGLFLSTDEQAAVLAPTSAVPGWTPPMTFPLTFPSFVGGPVDVDQTGSAPAEWVARIYGPCTGPKITNLTIGKQLYLPGLVVPDGDYLELDSAARTILLDGISSSSRYSFLDFATSEWWQLPPGVSTVELTADSSTDPSQMTFVWRHTSIL